MYRHAVISGHMFFHFQYLLPTPISQSSKMDYMIIVVQQNHLGDSSLFSCNLPDIE